LTVFSVYFSKFLVLLSVHLFVFTARTGIYHFFDLIPASAKTKQFFIDFFSAIRFSWKAVEPSWLTDTHCFHAPVSCSFYIIWYQGAMCQWHTFSV